ncbi:MAG: DUF2723 domain-containing protein [Porphyromonas sp.]|nr:DUF2723 domain-containing protein [Porphyromonas sp.]
MDIKKYRLIERVTAWAIFLISTAVYLVTMEKSASVWDCPEFITTFTKMEVGHPPGAPFYMLVYSTLANFFPSGGQWIAIAANSISSIFSGLTIMLLFLTTAHLIHRADWLRTSWEASAKLTSTQVTLYLGGGAVAALLYAFTDTFWYSAVEAEVYAMSSFFTALVFYLMLKWEQQADQPNADRWILVIAYLMGLSVGVHLLNLLTIPAMALIYYFRKSDHPGVKGAIISVLVSFAIIAALMFGIMQGVPQVAGYFDLFFVNTLGLGFNSGLVVYLLVMVALLGVTYYLTVSRPVKAQWLRVAFFASVILIGIPFMGDGWVIPTVIIVGLGAYLFGAKRLPVHIMNISTMGMMLFLFGMSTYGVMLIRANSDVPMNQNNPSDVFSLRYYLSREQYGKTPLIYGPTYASIPSYDIDGKAKTKKTVTYRRNGDRYEKQVGEEVIYRNDMQMLFPRMYNNSFPHYKQGYEIWGDVVGETMHINERGQMRSVTVPTFMENLRYFFSYQVNYMYWRYFLWNFSGRQNDLQGQGEIHKGNWITGIPFIDGLFLGPQKDMPDFVSANKGHNRYFMLPLILGLLGLVAQLYGNRRSKENFWIILSLFFMTGLAIVLYLNQPPYQVRERDYAYAGSFYAFAIWIGIAVPALYGMIKKSRKESPALAGLLTAVGLGVVGLVFQQNFDDHNRHGRSLASDSGNNYLESCEEDAIIFCNGDNDTFPLWYAQEVEGVRRDIRVCNTSYLQADWYIDQMKRWNYEAAPLPITWTPQQYGGEKRLVAYIIPNVSDAISVRMGLDFVASDDPKFKQVPRIAQPIDYLPAELLSLPFDTDRLIANGTLMPTDTALFDRPEMIFDFTQKQYLGRHELIILDMLDANKFERPMYYAITVGEDQRLGMTPNFRQTGMAYRILPIKVKGTDAQVDLERMYINVTQKFRWAGADIPGTYFDENSRKQMETYRSMIFAPLAKGLAERGEVDKAREILALSERAVLEENIPHSISSLPLVEAYYVAGLHEKGDEIASAVMDRYLKELDWFYRLDPAQLVMSLATIEQSVMILTETVKLSQSYKTPLEAKYADAVAQHQNAYLAIYSTISEQ